MEISSQQANSNNLEGNFVEENFVNETELTAQEVPETRQNSIVPSESEHYSNTENKPPANRTQVHTPEGRRTDFWNEPGYNENPVVASEESTVIADKLEQEQRLLLPTENSGSSYEQKAGDKLRSRSKNYKKRVCSATTVDPFSNDHSATQRRPSSFLNLLTSIASNTATQTKESKEIKLSTVDRAIQISPTRPNDGNQKGYEQATCKFQLPASIRYTDKNYVRNYFPNIYEPPNNPSASSEGIGESSDPASDTYSRSRTSGSFEDPNSMDDSRNIFSKIGKLFEQTSKVEEARARSLLVSYQFSIQEKINNLKRARASEFDEFLAEMNGTVKKRIRGICDSVRLSIAEAGKEIQLSKEINMKGLRKNSRVRKGESKGKGAQHIAAMCRERRKEAGTILSTLDK
ncbi:hypothetical protein BDZ91DRAFT_709399 [Kalaharituber pfeilii]|nr:hypothetical protein BDZ91DRAFT_709399 [Kalaharituber pfeilii]